MNSSRIRMTNKYGEPAPPNVFSDFDWMRRHEAELLEKFGERFIIVFNQQVIGVGDTYPAAIEDAERNLPPESGEVTPVYRELRHRHPFLRVRPTIKK
jgi:hypothetical protein